MTRRSKNPPTRRVIDAAVRRLIVAVRDHEMKGAHDLADGLSIELEFERAWASLNARLDVLFNEQFELVGMLREVVEHYESLIESDSAAAERARAGELAPVLALLAKYGVKS